MEGQQRLLGSLDLAGLFALEGAGVRVHDRPPDRPPVGTRAARPGNPGGACTIELLAARIFNDRAALAGRSLKSLWIIRQFGEGSEPVASCSGWSETALTRFPLRPGEGAGAADAELEDACVANLRQFAARAAIAPDAKRRRRLPTGAGPTPAASPAEDMPR